MVKLSEYESLYRQFQEQQEQIKVLQLELLNKNTQLERLLDDYVEAKMLLSKIKGLLEIHSKKDPISTITEEKD